MTLPAAVVQFGRQFAADTVLVKGYSLPCLFCSPGLALESQVSRCLEHAITHLVLSLLVEASSVVLLYRILLCCYRIASGSFAGDIAAGLEHYCKTPSPATTPLWLAQEQRIVLLSPLGCCSDADRVDHVSFRAPARLPLACY